MKSYLIKKIFGPTVQGEGALAGTPCLFVRFSGCNVWDGREETKSSSQCPYCDTDFRGGEKLTRKEIVARLKSLRSKGLVVLSGGEPMLQLDRELTIELRAAGYRLALETNGSVQIPFDLHCTLDHVTVSPKQRYQDTFVFYADELKLLYPHPNPEITPESFEDFRADHRFLQPINGQNELDPISTAAALQKVYELGDPWRLSVQTHKVIGVE